MEKELEQKLQNRIRLLEENLKKPDDKLTFLNNFFLLYKFNSIENIVKIDCNSLFIAYLLLNDFNLPMNELKKKAISLQNIWTYFNESVINNLFSILDIKSKNGKIEDMKNYIKEGKKNNNIKVGEKIFLTMISHMAYKGVEESRKKESMYNLLELYSMEAQQLKNILIILSLLNHAKAVYSNYEKAYQKLSSLEPDKMGNTFKKEQENTVLEKFPIEKFTSFINDMLSKYCEYKKTYNSEKKNIIDEVVKEKEVLKEFSKLYDKKEIREIDSLITKVTDPNLRLILLKIIYKHNSLYYQSLTETYKSITANKSSAYQSLLRDYGIYIEEENLSSIQDESLNILKEKLEITTKLLKITDPNLLWISICNSSVDSLKKLHNCFTYLKVNSRDFISINSELLDSSSKVYKNFTENMNFLLEKNVNIWIFINDLSILFTDTFLFQTNISIVEQYNLLGYLNNCIDYTFLKKTNLSHKIDMILELGFEDYLISNLNLLNKDTWLRCYLLKEIGLQVTNEQDLLDILDKKKFFIPDCEIESYLLNMLDYSNSIDFSSYKNKPNLESALLDLSKYINTERTYSIDGVLISIPKVQTNLAILGNYNYPEVEKIWRSITSQSILTENEYQILVSKLNSPISIKSYKKV